MIERVVLIKLKDEYSNDEGRAAVAQRSREDLPRVEGVRAVSVGLSVEQGGPKNWDLLLVVQFDAVADIERYIDDPVHRGYVDDFLKPRLEVLKAWNFDIG